MAEEEKNVTVEEFSVRTAPPVPDPILDDREIESLAELTERYEKLVKPGMLAKAAGKVGDLVPDKLRDAFEGFGESLSEQELYAKLMGVLASGFKTIEEQAARVTTSPQTVIGRANEICADGSFASLEELCLLRSYDAKKIQDKDRLAHLSSALVEGAATGAGGAAGIPFNIVLSMFLYYRAVQSVAMCYGYDTRNDLAELQIAGDVFSLALGVEEGTEHVAKFMAYGQLAVVKSTAKQTWSAMAERNTLTLLVTQIRALANKSAAKALENTGQKSLEKNIFSDLLEQVGKKLTLKTTGRLVPIVGAVVGGLFDTATMNKVLDMADTFYNKRFIAEKEERIDALLQSTAIDVPAEEGDISEDE